MNSKVAKALALLLCALSCAQAQTFDTLEIVMDGETTAIKTLHHDYGTPYTAEDMQQPFVPFLSHLNPYNNTNVMKQWVILNDLFRTNGIRLGITMCSISCGTDVQARDYARGKAVVEEALAKGLIDNTILKLEIRGAEPTAGPCGSCEAGSPSVQP